MAVVRRLLWYVVAAALCLVIRADSGRGVEGVGSEGFDASGLKSEIEQLKSRINALELEKSKPAMDRKHKDMIIYEKDSIIKEKSDKVASLQNDLASIKVTSLDMFIRGRMIHQDRGNCIFEDEREALLLFPNLKSPIFSDMAGSATGSAEQLPPAVPSAWAKGPPSSCRTAPLPTSPSLFPPINLAARQPGSKEGCPAISFTSAEVQEGRQRLQHSLVAKFSGGRPKVEVIRRVFVEDWALAGVASIGAWDARHILIVLKSEEDAKRVLAHPLRKIDQYYFRVFRWSPEFHARRESTVVTTWVRLPAFPPELFDQGFIKPIISLIGNFIAIDDKTKQLVNPSFARACVEIDVSKTIPEKIWVGLGGHGYWQYLDFESNLLYCSRCRIHGHQISGCRKVKALGGATNDQALTVHKTISKPELQGVQPPDKVAAAPASTQILQNLNLPPLRVSGTRELQQIEDGSIEHGVWQVPNKRKSAKRDLTKDKEYRVKLPPKPIIESTNRTCLEVVSSSLDSASPQKQLDLAEKQLDVAASHTPLNFIPLPEPGPIAKAFISKPLTEDSSLVNEVLHQPQVNLTSTSPTSATKVCLGAVDIAKDDVSIKDSTHSTMVLEGHSSPKKISIASGVDDSLDVIATDCPIVPGIVPSNSGSSGRSSRTNFLDPDPSTLSSAHRKSLFQAERKAEKAARKAERKAKYNRKQNFTFDD